MVKRKETVPKDETKKDKFRRIVEPRVGKAIKMIGLIGNCAGSDYEYTSADVAHILAALEGAISELDKVFQGKGRKQTGFTFS